MADDAPGFAGDAVTLIRRLAWAALVIGFGQVVFGAIVRITGSGLGCGNHWPDCNGFLIPPLDRPDLIIEVLHRYFAAGLTVAIVALLAVSAARRAQAGVGGAGGVLRAATLAATLVVTAALFGGLIVKLDLQNRYVVVVHVAIAMSLLATLASAVVRSGGLGAVVPGFATAGKTWRGARALGAMLFVVLLLGALVANLPAGASACTGFPLCRGGTAGPMQHLQLTHRIVAFLVFFHALGLVIGVARRGDAQPVRGWAWATFALIVAQILIAAALVETGFPLVLRSLHQATGTLTWIVACIFALLAHRTAGGALAGSARGAAA